MSEEAPSTTPSLDPEVVSAFDRAQSATIALARHVVGQLREGMSEAEIADLAVAAAPQHGFDRWFHRPEVRFNAPKVEPLTLGRAKALKVGTVVEIDLAPANATAFGDFGHALVFGGGDEPDVLRESRALLRGAVGFASRWKCTGEVFVFAQAWANNHNYSLGEATSVGHRCLPPEGLLAQAWPRLSKAAILMRRNQIEWFNYRRMAGLYAIQPRLVVGDHACSFEEMVLIDGDTKRVLGRASLDEVGTL